MSKNLNVAVLLDFYGDMLTEKQSDLVDLYYNQDLSLGEIAQHEGITRQGVRDAIKRGEAYLYELEDKLGLLATHIETQKIIESIRNCAMKIQTENSTYNYSLVIKNEVLQMIELTDEYMKIIE